MVFAPGYCGWWRCHGAEFFGDTLDGEMDLSQREWQEMEPHSADGWVLCEGGYAGRRSCGPPQWVGLELSCPLPDSWHLDAARYNFGVAVRTEI